MIRTVPRLFALALHWAPVALLPVFVAVMVSYALLCTGYPGDKLPLAGVPDEEISRAGIALLPRSDTAPIISRDLAQESARRLAACGNIQQTVLVDLTSASDPSQRFPAWAINYDTSTAQSVGLEGGFYKTSCTSSQAFFVLFFDARSGKHIYSLFPGTEYPFPDSPVSLPGLGPPYLSSVGLSFEEPRPGDQPLALPDLDTVPDPERLSPGTVREALLARVHDSARPDRGRPLWVVLTGMRSEPPAYERKVAFIFFHPETGRFVYSRDAPCCGVAIQGFDTRDMELHGISLNVPDRSPTTTRDQAVAVAVAGDAERKASVREVVLATFVATLGQPAQYGLAWVVNFGPGQPLTFVDAESGQFLFAYEPEVP